MFKTVLSTAENVAVIAAVGVQVHYRAGLDWPWAIVIGAAVLIALVRAGTIEQGSRVLFIHTGGVPALFAYEPDLRL